MELKVQEAKAWDTSGSEAQAEFVRADVVETVLAVLRAAGLFYAEYLAVVGAIHAVLAREIQAKTSVMVTATALTEGSVASATVLKECSAPGLVSETVELLVRAASPELWAQIRAVLEASDSELAAMVAVSHRAPA
jgi:hypothetical protein